MISAALADTHISTAESDEAKPDIAGMMQNARDASDYLKTLAHEHRLMLLCLLVEQERSVTELEDLLGLRQPTVSQQLAQLRQVGLVTTRRECKAIYYSLADAGTRDVIQLIHDRFCKR